MSEKRPVKNILFYGVGGQGVLSAAGVCALAALYEGHHVKQSEVKGMAQRGGSVDSFVRFGAEVLSPLPDSRQVDILVCLFKSEYPRWKEELRPDGIDLLPYLDLAHKAVGERKTFLNAYMLGVVSSVLPFREDSWLKAIGTKFTREQDRNREYFFEGRKAGGRG